MENIAPAALGFRRDGRGNADSMATPKRDRDGEIFQNDLTNNEDAPPSAVEEGVHHLAADPDIDSEEDDETNPEFAKELRKSGHGSGH